MHVFFPLLVKDFTVTGGHAVLNTTSGVTFATLRCESAEEKDKATSTDICMFEEPLPGITLGVANTLPDETCEYPVETFIDKLAASPRVAGSCGHSLSCTSTGRGHCNACNSTGGHKIHLMVIVFSLLSLVLVGGGLLLLLAEVVIDDAFVDVLALKKEMPKTNVRGP